MVEYYIQCTQRAHMRTALSIKTEIKNTNSAFTYTAVPHCLCYDVRNDVVWRHSDHTTVSHPLISFENRIAVLIRKEMAMLSIIIHASGLLCDVSARGTHKSHCARYRGTNPLSASPWTAVTVSGEFPGAASSQNILVWKVSIRRLVPESPSVRLGTYDAVRSCVLRMVSCNM